MNPRERTDLNTTLRPSHVIRIRARRKPNAHATNALARKRPHRLPGDDVEDGLSSLVGIDGTFRHRHLLQQAWRGDVKGTVDLPR